MNRQEKVNALIQQMGTKWMGHKEFKPKARSYLPMPNLAGRQPCIQHCDTGLRGQLKALLMWAAL